MFIAGMALLTIVLLLSLLGIDWRKEAIKTRLRMKQFARPTTSDSRLDGSHRAHRRDSERVISNTRPTSTGNRRQSMYDSFINEDNDTNTTVVGGGRRRVVEDEEDDLHDSIEDDEEHWRASTSDAVHLRTAAASIFTSSSTAFNVLHYPSAEEELAELELVEFAAVRS